ncbi:MAG: D-2-hydroxyacid dehydrogenase [Caldilineaceae bacterium]|nr:D-2-hydroxyacid dehydrogenase [Caldilineaceae bacterium]
MPEAHMRLVVGLSPQMRGILGEGVLRQLAEAHPDVMVFFAEDKVDFTTLAAEADAALVSPPFTIPSEWLATGARLRWVQAATAGVDFLLTPALRTAPHVAITSTKGPMGPLMAEHVVMLMLALARDLPGFLQDQAERRWRHMMDERPMAQLFEKTIAILGVGAVGGNLARMCKAGFGMTVLGLARRRRNDPHVDRYFDREGLHAALAQADFVALTLPLTPATERIIDEAALAAMKPAAYLVNVSRGGLVDEEALAAALRSGRLAGAGLDATAVEPLPAGSPLWEIPNVIITPHVAPARDRLGEHMVDFWCENIRRFAEGRELLGLVDRLAGY